MKRVEARLVLIFRHVEPHHHLFRAELDLGKYLRKLRFADARRADKKEARDRAALAREPAPVFAESLARPLSPLHPGRRDVRG
jgi:hypothetical protein